MGQELLVLAARIDVSIGRGLVRVSRVDVQTVLAVFWEAQEEGNNVATGRMGHKLGQFLLVASIHVQSGQEVRKRSSHPELNLQLSA